MHKIKLAIFVTLIVYSAELTQGYFGNTNIRKWEISDEINEEADESRDISKRYFGSPSIFKRQRADEINKESFEREDIPKRYFGTPDIFKRQNTRKCFESADDFAQQDKNIQDIFSDESVRKCFTSQRIDTEFYKLLAINDTERIGEAFDAQVSKFCPTWPTSKKCIYNYLKSNCNPKEIEKVKESDSFYNRHLEFPVLMCETRWQPLSRFFAQSWPNVGFSECFSNRDNLLKFSTCSTNKMEVHIESGSLPSFKKTVSEYLACAQTVITDCASGDDKSTELEMKVVMNLIEDTLKNSFDSFWSDFEVQ